MSQGSQYLKSKLYITPSRASKSAIEAIEKLGGVVVCKYYNPLALQDMSKGRSDHTEAAPTNRRDISTPTAPFIAVLCRTHVVCIVWYSQDRNRGYISPKTLERFSEMPFVEERWKVLASELGKWKGQDFDRQKKI